MPKKREQLLVDEIKRHLGGIRDLYFFKQHGGIYGTAGVPDLIICYKGKFAALECKASGRKPTVLQQIAIRQINAAGGIAAVVYSLEDAKEVIRKIE
jgi:hypothetical protein